jgi:hypothetical protein
MTIADDERRRLHEDVAGIAHIVRGAGDDDDAVDGGRDAEREQQHVRFLKKFPNGAQNRPHGIAPFPKVFLL